MTDEVWARHANPMSVWTRYAALPFLVLTIWSRVWLGPWCWPLIGVVVIWIWINPRVFPKPTSTDSWASRAVLGERVWLRRKELPVPEHHCRAPNVLSIFSLLGLAAAVYGLIELRLWPAVLGTLLVILAKSWFLDRMVWLYADMQDATPEYRSWLY
jgi:hypothetical protein